MTVPLLNTIAVETWGYTQMNVVQLSFVWTIVNYSFLLQETGQKLISPTFSAGDDENKWQLELYPKGSHEDYEDYLMLQLTLKSSKESQVKAKLKLSILSANNTKIEALEWENVFKTSNNRSGYWATKRDVLFREKENLLPNDTLRVLCEVNATTDVFVTSGPKGRINFNAMEGQLPNDLKLLFESGKFSDITLVSGGNEFQAHKLILAARSSVFLELLGVNPEINETRLEIMPMGENVLREMLRFIYTDTVENLNDLAGDLLMVADRYNLKKLKIMCEDSLFKRLSIENAADTLMIADDGNAELLKANVLDFINTHARVVMATKSFTSMVDSHPWLAAEILRKIIMFV